MVVSSNILTDQRDISFHKQLIETGQLPVGLYKYTRISDQLINGLCNCELHFSSPGSFNDPFDCQINDQTKWTKDSINEYIQINEKFFTEIGKRVALSMPVHQFSDFFKKNIADVFSNLGISCFSKRPNNLLLWAHYADKHAGICLKFDITKDENFFNWTFPINYSDNYPVYDFVINKNEISNTMILTKSVHWSYEEEYRTISKQPGLFKFDKASLVEVTFGCKTNQNDIDSIKQKLNSNGFDHIKYRTSKVSLTQFEIEFNDI